MLLSSFMPSTKLRTREEVAVAVHRAFVEIHALREASMPLVITSTWEDNLPELSGTSFSQDVNGNVKLDFTNDGLRNRVLESTSKAEIEEDEIVLSQEDVLEEIERNTEQANDETRASVVDPELLQTSGTELDSISEGQEASSLDAASKDDNWRNLSLDDPEIKFAVCDCPQLRGSLADDFAGAEACHAADRHTHSGSGD